MLKEDKIYLAQTALKKDLYPSEAAYSDLTAASETNPLINLEMSIPHPTETFVQQIERHERLWGQMAQGFGEFVNNLAFWEEARDEEKSQILAGIEKVPQVAAECFEAQYFELARRYEEFAVWANLREHEETKVLIGSLSEYVQQQAALAESAKTAIDIGFARMQDAVLSIPETLKITQAAEIFDGLKRHSDNLILEPIAEEKGEQEEGIPRLKFPKICDAFIPQSFKVLRWTSKLKSLEDEATWNGFERREDLNAFLLNYLSSPYSMETPLVVLGHPGSGKSLLTKVLSAQLMSKHYTVIRVPLREVDSDANIRTQIEERIHRVTSQSECWPILSKAFKNNPPLVILDGYDELLQASGRVFSKYLKDVQTFQNEEVVQGRPVRVIVTSRITLIDKADIPSGATIIRLLEFSKRQRDQWISIWNQENANYFIEAGIQEFDLPTENADDAAKILALAEQPLLLLMLALYDSEGNQLRKSESLDRTILYDSLLRRFVERERTKDQKFEELEDFDQRKEIEKEMQRLAVAALGMYNRRKLHILSPELNDDINFFNLARKVSVSDRRPMTQADLLLGSFFFVHKSKVQVKAGAPEHHQEAGAFEFLHNTFGEFLTADFIIRQAMVEVAALKALKEHDDLRGQLEKKLGDANGLSREWFASLVYTPLFTRPVVLEMMHEWIDHALKRKQLSKQDFLYQLDAIILNQIKRLLSKREMPAIIRKETAQEGYRAPFGDHPLLGHVAIYSINLILLRIVVADEPLIFDEEAIGTYEDGTRPWDRLTHIWRSWFSVDNLNGVTAVMLSDRQDSQITVKAKDKFQVAESQNRLATCLNVAVSLGDNISSGIAGLLIYEPSDDVPLGIEDISRRLESEKIDLNFQIAMKQLFRNEHRVNSHNIQEFTKSVSHILEKALHADKRDELEHIAISLQHVAMALGQRKFGNYLSREIDPELAANVVMRNPQAAVVLFQQIWLTLDSSWYRYFFDYLFRMTRRNKGEFEAVLSFMQLAREFGGEETMRWFSSEFFERAFDPRYLLEISKRNPEVALSFFIQAASEIEFERLPNRYILEIIDFLTKFDWSPRQKPTAIAVQLRLARIAKSYEAIDLVLKSLISPDGDVFSLQMLPMAALGDLEWLVNTTDNSVIDSALSRLLDDVPIFEIRQRPARDS
ncbi:MAG: ATP-binding protein [Methanosarcinales archaeon]|nr:ATP-binding protein [Methanosarcinales archaeon]